MVIGIFQEPVLYSRDIARYSFLKNAVVLTTDSDFLFYNLDGVIFMNLENNGTLYVTKRSLLMEQLGIEEFQLLYFVVLSGNDFSSRQALKCGDSQKYLNSEELLDEIKTRCKTMEDCEKHFRENTNLELRDYFEKVQNLYQSEQVDYPWNALTTDVEEAKAIRSLSLEGWLRAQDVSFRYADPSLQRIPD